MFYQSHDEIDVNLRFGDVISGFQFISFSINEYPAVVHDFKLDFSSKKFYVVLTPCCSIENGALVITPLEQLLASFFKLPYFTEDFTRINRITNPGDMLTEQARQNMTTDQINSFLSRQPSYAYVENFVYSGNPSLPEYELKHKNTTIARTGFYMINFKNILQINSPKFNRPVQIPKILQLSILARDELREKIGNYYKRIPDEDAIK